MKLRKFPRNRTAIYKQLENSREKKIRGQIGEA